MLSESVTGITSSAASSETALPQMYSDRRYIPTAHHASKKSQWLLRARRCAEDRASHKLLMYHSAIKNTWTVKEVDLSTDLQDLRTKISAAEHHLV